MLIHSHTVKETFTLLRRLRRLTLYRELSHIVLSFHVRAVLMSTWNYRWWLTISSVGANYGKAEPFFPQTLEIPYTQWSGDVNAALPFLGAATDGTTQDQQKGEERAELHIPTEPNEPLSTERCCNNCRGHMALHADLIYGSDQVWLLRHHVLRMYSARTK